MACVILIHAKNWQERNRVLRSLDDDISSEVIVDLKKYVEQKYKGRFVSEEEIGGGGNSTQIATTGPVGVDKKNIPLLKTMPQNNQIIETRGNASTSMNTIVPEEDGYGTFIPYRNRMVVPKNEVVIEELAEEADNKCVINSVAVPSQIFDAEVKNIARVANILQNESAVEGSHSNIANNIPPIDNGLSPATDINDTDSATSDEIPLSAPLSASIEVEAALPFDNIPNTDDNGIDVLCFEIVVSDVLLTNNTTNSQPPVTLRRSTRSMTRTTNDVTVKKIPSVKKVSSRSKVRKSGRVAKRPRHLMAGEDSEYVCPVPKKVCSTSRKQARKETDGIECKKCLKQLSPQYRIYSTAKDHAIIHTDLKRFECPVDGCGYKSGPCQNMTSHTRIKHKGILLPTRKIVLTAEQEEELDRMVKECFPIFGTRDEYKTCALCQATISNNSLHQHHPKRHVLQHVGFMLYRCNQQNCQYESKYYREMVKHGSRIHGIEEISRKKTEIELTDRQKKEIDEMLKKCFPDEDVEE